MYQAYRPIMSIRQF